MVARCGTRECDVCGRTWREVPMRGSFVCEWCDVASGYAWRRRREAEELVGNCARFIVLLGIIIGLAALLCSLNSCTADPEAPVLDFARAVDVRPAAGDIARLQADVDAPAPGAPDVSGPDASSDGKDAAPADSPAPDVAPACTAAACDDGNPCTVDHCDDGNACTHEQLQVGACDDGDPCTTSQCVAGECVVVKFKDCNDGNPCTTDACIGDCVHEALPNGSWCPGAKPYNWRCVKGACVKL